MLGEMRQQCKMQTARPLDPWQITNHLVMRDLKTGNLYSFIGSSRGFLMAVGELCVIYGRHRQEKPKELPIIELGFRQYDHPQYEVLNVPIFRLVGWPT
jgi:hypothetical protein